MNASTTALAVMTYYSQAQRMSQMLALRALHAQANALAFAPHTPKYTAVQEPFSLPVHTGKALPATNCVTDQWHDGWQLVHGQAPHTPTFRLFARRYGPEPIACDFVFVSDALVEQMAAAAGSLKQLADDQVRAVSVFKPPQSAGQPLLPY
jgi:hypothetical protein